MVAERGFKFQMNELYDGVNKSYEDYHFDTFNTLTNQAKAE